MKTGKLPRRKNLVSREQASKILEPFTERLVDTLDQAWNWVQDILDEDTERRLTFDSSLEAAMINRRFVDLSRIWLEQESGVKIQMFGRHMSVLIDGGLNLRFKKLDSKLKSGNVRTNRQDEKYNQTLFDLNKHTEVTFGYVLTPAGNDIHGLYITCPIGWTRNAWMIALRDPGFGEIPLFTGDDAPDNSEVIVKPKTTRSVEDTA